jgi:hypothetical protein
MATVPSEEVKKAFLDLACRISPENLSCDGELSQTQVRARLSQIQREWKALEKQIKMKVSEDMVWDWDTAGSTWFGK